MKKKYLIFLVFSIVAVIGTFADEQIYIGKNDNIIRWDNRLPGTFPKINNIKYFGDMFENYMSNDGGIPNCRIATSFDKNQVVISFSTDDQRYCDGWLYSETDNEINPTLALKIFEYLNSWFFDDIQILNPDKKSIINDLNDLSFIYVYTQYKGNDYLQIQGRIGRARDTWGNYRSGMLPLEPFFIKVGQYSGKIYGLYGMLNSFGVSLEKPYNAITKEYNGSYLVYLFFGDQERIRDIPPLK